MKNGTILIIDDNEDVLFALNLLLEPYVEQIKVTTQPERIEHFMSTFVPDVILLDMNFRRDAISGQEGFFWLEKIKAADPDAVVLFITAYADTEKAVRAIKAGATDFIPKPWEKEKLLATLSAALKLRESRTEINTLKQRVEALGSPDAGIVCHDCQTEGYGCQYSDFRRKRDWKGSDCTRSLSSFAPLQPGFYQYRSWEYPGTII